LKRKLQEANTIGAKIGFQKYELNLHKENAKRKDQRKNPARNLSTQTKMGERSIVEGILIFRRLLAGL